MWPSLPHTYLPLTISGVWLQWPVPACTIFATVRIANRQRCAGDFGAC